MSKGSQKAVIATRGSKLALWQAHFIAAKLGALGLETDIQIVQTTGDRVQSRYLYEIGGKGLFVKELEQALAAGQADLAVHSLKDMPARLPAGFILAAVSKRHVPTDVLIPAGRLRQSMPAAGQLLGEQDVRSLGKATIGTASLRRQSLLCGANADLDIVGVRGNVDTRIGKLRGGDFDGLILAEASLERLGLSDVERWRLDPDWFVPCAGQGALAIETRADSSLAPLIAQLGCADSTRDVTIERTVLARLGGDCTMPLGCHVYQSADHPGRLIATVALLSKDGRAARATSETLLGSGFSAEIFVEQILAALKKNGGPEILRGLGIKAPEELGWN